MNELTINIARYLTEEFRKNNFETYYIDIDEIFSKFEFLKDRAIRKDVIVELKQILRESLIELVLDGDPRIRSIFLDMLYDIDKYNFTLKLYQLDQIVRNSIRKHMHDVMYLDSVLDNIDVNLHNKYFTYRLNTVSSIKILFIVVKENKDVKKTLILKTKIILVYRGAEFDNFYSQETLNLISKIMEEHSL